MPFPATHPTLASALLARGYEEPTPVQLAVLQPETEGRDLLVSAQTGSGKTVAYGLAAAPTLMGDADRLPRATAPLALVIAPTRELAMQVHKELAWLYADAGARIVACIGGMDVRREARALEGGCHIVVGTPGRLCDHLSRGRLNTGSLRVVVLDEADEMLDLGFKDELEQILSATPTDRRTLLFSATIAREIATLARKYQRDAMRIDTVSGTRQHADIDYRAVLAAPNEAEHAVVNVLRWFESPTAMVFCSTRDMVRHMQSSLQERGFSAVALSGELSQAERTRALDALRSGGARVCVATDVAARGIDLPDLGLVIHAALPSDSATLLHRSGRTGRAGRKGTCVLVVPAIRRRKAEQLLAGARVQAHWSGAPTADEIRTRDGERLLADPILTEEFTPEDQALGQALLAGRSPEEIAAALVRLYRANLPDPEEIRAMSVGPERRPQAVHGSNERYERAERPARAPRADRSGDDRPRPERSNDDRPRPERSNDDRSNEPSVWFGMPIGRQDKADPKWLVPLICRLGGVTKRDIGSIKIFDGETRFEITQSMAERFTACIAATDDDEVTISASSAPTTGTSPRPQRDASGPGYNKEAYNKGAPPRRSSAAPADRRRTAPKLNSSRKRAS
ncbi:DEAD/DEAH box helicase [Lichenicola cladoniae]|uniref:DEAD/DEAH box helicase n=1 Tax=Lichenicola cladoniae TaxID=1484109 RepID=A0A6M8HSA2_9PROT|nr:DEAD/DEAH box helicase [Lichenicola cladoniae]NPD65776.1 DEAD/DEAH box helicase [Acetobacteraceae bacterium]QKE91210.1 DEAD/DEAH box helicase [Lichenicola cladoniae]